MTNAFLYLCLSAIPLIFCPLNESEGKKFSPFFSQLFLFSDSRQWWRSFDIRVQPRGSRVLSQMQAAFESESGGSRRHVIVKR